MSTTSNISASTWPNVKSKDSFEILRLTLLFDFGQVEAEILPKNKLTTFFVDIVYDMGGHVLVMRGQISIL